MADKLILGPFIKVYRFGQLLLLKPDPAYADRILEQNLKTGLKISPEKIYKAYKNNRGRIWIMVEFMKGYDLYKHFRLSPRDRYASRIPRILVEVCPSCGGDIVDNLCLDCGGEVEKPKLLEVWRDREALEEQVPVDKLEEHIESLTIISGKDRITIPRHILHERLVKFVKDDVSLYARILSIHG